MDDKTVAEIRKEQGMQLISNNYEAVASLRRQMVALSPEMNQWLEVNSERLEKFFDLFAAFKKAMDKLDRGIQNLVDAAIISQGDAKPYIDALNAERSKLPAFFKISKELVTIYTDSIKAKCIRADVTKVYDDETTIKRDKTIKRPLETADRPLEPAHHGM